MTNSKAEGCYFNHSIGRLIHAISEYVIVFRLHAEVTEYEIQMILSNDNK